MTTPDDNPQTLEKMLSSLIDEQKEFRQAIFAKIDGLSGELKTVQNDLGVVKGGHARTEVLRKNSLIATDMGYRFVKNLSRRQIETIADKGTEFDPGELMSFRHADVIMEATDHEGGSHYIAVEVSYTVGENDVRRAIRNAKFLRALTEHNAHAAVAGVDIVPVAKKSVDAGDVHWYRIPPRDIQPE